MDSGLPGKFQPDRAGKRMKLPTPVTWETQLSALGNKASTWESLLDQRKLPFMAMLRNLRNMLVTGISNRHHDGIIDVSSRSARVPLRVSCKLTDVACCLCSVSRMSVR